MREKLRLAILSAYGIDINNYKFEYKSSLDAYTINTQDFTIRITTSNDIDKETKLARLKWAKDLKEFKNTICEPILSNNGELLEELIIGKWHLTISMYRTAKGKLIGPSDITPMTLISAGDMLGTMHKMSMHRDESAKQYIIPTPEKAYEKKRQRVKKYLNPDLNARIDNIIHEISAVEKTSENYGICYGEYDLHNIIVDTNNIHLFDFDSSIYAHYLYDVASFAVSLLSAGYLPRHKSKDVVFNVIIPWFRIGYSINKPCKENTFDDIELYMNTRGVWLLINLLEKYQKEELPEIKGQIDFVSEILLGKNIFDGIDKVRKVLFN